MKALKIFGIFFLYPVVMLGTGFLGGVTFMKYFYPGDSTVRIEEIQDYEELHTDWQKVTGELPGTVDGSGINAATDGLSFQEAEESTDQEKDLNGTQADQETDQDSLEDVFWFSEKLNADTAYVLEETDLRNNTIVETTWKLPAKYIGMNREEFLEAMDLYAASPPLEELERGFVSLEVLSFSKEKVVIQMNYEYIQPGSSFYLMVENNYVVVYLEDMETVYMDTDILLTDLPEELQQDIIRVMYVPDEESLYSFLENYTS